MKQIIKILFVIILLSQTVSAANSTVFNIDKVSNTLTRTFENNIHTEINVVDNADRITSLTFKMLNNPDNTSYVIRFSNNISYYVKYTKYYEYTFFGYGGIPYRNEKIYLLVTNSSNTSQTYSIYSSNLNWSFITSQNPTTEITYSITDSSTFYKTFPNMLSLNFSFFETSVFWGMPATNISIDSTSPFDLTITVQDISVITTIEQQKKKLSTISKYVYSAYSNTLGLIYGDSELFLDILSLLDILFSIISGIFILVFVYPYLILMYIIIAINYKTIWESKYLKEFITNYGKNLKAVSKMAVYVGTLIWYFLLQVIQTIIRIGSFLRQLLQI